MPIPTYRPRRLANTFLPVVVMMAAAFSSCMTPWAKHATERRERTYQSVLRAYKDDLKFGTSRTEVEAYLKSKNAGIEHTCSPGCSDDPAATAMPDYVLLGKGSPPWYCSAELVFLDLQFDSVEPQQKGVSSASDKLKSITIRRALRDCM